MPLIQWIMQNLQPVPPPPPPRPRPTPPPSRLSGGGGSSSDSGDQGLFEFDFEDLDDVVDAEAAEAAEAADAPTADAPAADASTADAALPPPAPLPEQPPDDDPLDAEVLAEAAESVEDALRDAFLVEIAATSLVVEVCATVLPVQVVERGNLIYFTARFRDDPEAVHFTYTRPGEERPVADSGYGQRGSSIRRLARGLYLFTLDTTGFRGGLLCWHFFGEGKNKASDFGEIQIPARKAQLL